MAQEEDVFKELEQTIETHSLELAYENACREVERICDLEKTRRLDVRILTLEDESEGLQSQLAQSDERSVSLQKRNQELQEDLEVGGASLKSAQGDLRMKTREIETLKAELDSLHGVTMDSTKLLTEKLTLARELSSLRPEIDHLRSQAAAHQSLLAEKLSLQRQLNTMHVELETEKRSTQRILEKENKSQAEDARLASRVETLQADLAKERRERQRLERDAQKASMESENRKTTLESRLDAFRTKLKTTKEQLKETQTALDRAQTAARAPSDRTKSSTNSTAPFPVNTRKRAAIEMDNDTMIGTPGALPAAKKGKTASSMVGEKSTFSITPFLNRTASMAPESPPSEKPDDGGESSQEPEDIAPESDEPEPVSKPTARNLKSTKRTAKPSDPGVLENANPSKTNARGSHLRKPKVPPVLEEVAEEEGAENDGAAVPNSRAIEGVDVLSESCIGGTAEIKKKKRKLFGGGLGKTLFDEDEGDVMNSEGAVAAGTKMFARGGLTGPKLGPRKALGQSLGSFGAISPLKKDRKGTS